VGDFYQSRDRVLVGEGAVVLHVGGRGDLDGCGHVVELVAAAALRSRTTSRGGTSIANEVALGLGAGRGLSARPRAFGSRASRSAVGNSRGADGLALGGQADVLAKRATRGLAVLA